MNEYAIDTNAKRKSIFIKIIIVILLIVGLFSLWRWTPLKEWATVEKIQSVATQIGSNPFAPVIFIAAYTVGAVTFFPRPLITMAAVIAFGPWFGFLYAMLGIVISTLITYGIGRCMNRETVSRFTGDKLDRMALKFSKANFLIIGALRLVPIAPFFIVNMFAGAIRIRVTHFTFGTALGMLPGALAATVFVDQATKYMEDRGSVNYLSVVGVAVLWVGVLYGVRVWWKKQK